eukprot:TRINITY_DN1483_c0_g1_i1.p1 TRINITY_DN1483_c0_g1~~TRINITY_DN1483_c0_g1_i1.p1  ORF type:complete len:526 (+),score=97.98 TRINITY_DN1483_c0_g1_i1:37-1578(+)
MNSWVLAVAVLLLGNCVVSDRVPGSPYPFSKAPTDVWVLDISALSAAYRLLANSLSGVVAQQRTTGDFLFLKDSATSFTLWLNEMATQYPEISIHYDYSNNVQGLLSKFTPMLLGYTICNSTTTDGARNAMAISGITSTVVATPETVQDVKNTGLQQLYNADSYTPSALFSKFESLWSTTILSHQNDPRYLTDYASFTKAFNFYDNTLETVLATNALNHLLPSSAVLGWGGDEYGFVNHATLKSKYVHAADWSLNLPVYTNMALKSVETRANQTSTSTTPHHTVCFIMSDGDNIQWLMNDFATNTMWWASPNRGKAPLGWTIAPALSELAPMLMSYYQRTQTPLDELVSGPSGAGYMYPDHWPSTDLPGYVTLNNALMTKAKQSVLTVIGDTFSLSTCNTLLANSPATGLIWYDYIDYAGMAGAVYWSSTNKVITGPRYILSSSMGLLPDQLASLLNAASTDVTSPNAYSIVAVHCWTMSVDDVLKTISLLDSDVLVVSPSEILASIAANIPH